MKSSMAELWLKMIGFGYHIQRMDNIQQQVDDLADRVHDLAKDSKEIRNSVELFKMDMENSKQSIAHLEKIISQKYK